MWYRLEGWELEAFLEYLKEEIITKVISWILFVWRNKNPFIFVPVCMCGWLLFYTSFNLVKSIVSYMSEFALCLIQNSVQHVHVLIYILIIRCIWNSNFENRQYEEHIEDFLKYIWWCVWYCIVKKQYQNVFTLSCFLVVLIHVYT